MGATFSDRVHICGMVVSTRAYGFSLKLWTKHADNESLQMRIGRELKECLCIPDNESIHYVSHVSCFATVHKYCLLCHSQIFFLQLCMQCRQMKRRLAKMQTLCMCCSVVQLTFAAAASKHHAGMHTSCRRGLTCTTEHLFENFDQQAS